MAAQKSDHWCNWFLAKPFAEAEPSVIAGVSERSIFQPRKDRIVYPPTTDPTRFDL